MSQGPYVGPTVPPGIYGGPSSAYPLPAFNPLVAGGQHYYPISPSNASTSGTNGTSTMKIAPTYLEAQTLIAVGGEITVVGDVGCKVRLGIYADNGNGYPGALVLDAGQIAGDAVAVSELAVGPLAIPAGWYWLGGVVQLVTTTTPTIRTIAAPALPIGWVIPLGTGLPSAGSTASCYSVGGFGGALPATFPGGAASGGATTVPRLFFKVQ
jgi:hypothetical protein